MIRNIVFPQSKTGFFKTSINIDGDILTIEALCNKVEREWIFSITNNGFTVSDLHPKSAMPLNYSMKNLQNFLVVPINSFNANLIGKDSEFVDKINNNFINVLFVIDTKPETFKELLTKLNLI